MNKNQKFLKLKKEWNLISYANDFSVTLQFF